jgi:hypothetical protein
MVVNLGSMETILAGWLRLKSAYDYEHNSMSSLQGLIDKQPPQSVLRLNPGEYQGPITISQPLTLAGKGVTIWSNQGPVVTISSTNVTLENIDIELSSSTNNGYIALRLEETSGIDLRNVGLRGSTQGFQHEDGIFLLPEVLNLGDIQISTVYSAKFIVSLPLKCTFETSIDGLTVSSEVMQGQLVRCNVQLEPFDYRVSLYGYITVRTSRVRRKIVVVGNIVAAAGNANHAVTQDTILWNACDLPIYATAVPQTSVANAKSVCEVATPPIIANASSVVSNVAVQPVTRVAPIRRFVKQSTGVDESVFNLGADKQDSLAVQTPVSNSKDALGTVFHLAQQVDNQPPDSDDWSSRQESSKSSIVKEVPNLLPDIFRKND